ncbi:MAG: ABC transporter ATP-binding protein [Dehalococcoidales bacterium]|nr:ABC transporter ATP-binding protein [Dehalococcoidales bacterium]
MADEQDAATRPLAFKIQGLTKSFGIRRALRDIDLEIESGKSVVIFGPNGAGKTTLMKILSTVMNPTSGTILVNGLDLKKHAWEIRQNIGIITHQTLLYGNLTGYENLNFYGRMFDVPDLQTRIREIVSLVGMTARQHDRVATLSRGMQQRFAIARALLHKPSIVLMDEPETGLDQEAIPLLWNAMPDESGRRRTIVLVTHSLERGLELGDNVIILNRGKIVFEGVREALDLAHLQATYRNSTSVSV